MKKLIAIALLVFTTSAYSQILDPVKWSTSVEKVSSTEYKLISKAVIENGWHLYSQTVPEGGPIATSFTYNSNGAYLKKGNTNEGEGHVVDDPIFGMKIKYFEIETVFEQRIKLKNTNAFPITATVTFMVCDDARCLPPTDKELVFKLQ